MRPTEAISAFLLAATAAATATAARTSDVDEFRVKRQGPFEFAAKCKLARRGDRVTISFASKAFCSR